MSNKRIDILTMLTVSVLLSSMILTLMQTNAQVSTDEHVYYGYVPPSTNLASGVDEVIHGQKINYTVPSGVAILDVVGLVDGTSIEIWDIYANQRLHSAALNKLEKKLFYIPVGTFFKIVATQRIAALLNGGGNVFADGSGGTSTFYPSVTGGFRGKEFIFNAAPPTHAQAYSQDKIGYNFYLISLEETDWALSDAIGSWSTSDQLHQRATKTILLQSMVNHHGLNNGAGNDVVFHLITTGDVEVLCCALDDYVAVPAITGGYVGKLFYAPQAVTFQEPGRTGVFIVVPLEEGEVRIYDEDLNVMATHSFTASDVTNRNYWYYELGVGRFNLIAKSTGNICFMVGQTEQSSTVISHMADDITFMGSKPGQEIRFYAPTMAVVFAPENLTITIDGGAPVEMTKDDLSLLETGAHSISADKHVIVEVLSGSDFDDWGSYLIEPSDVDVSFEAPTGFTSKPVDYTMYIAVAAAAIIAVLAVFIMRRRRASRV